MLAADEDFQRNREPRTTRFRQETVRANCITNKTINEKPRKQRKKRIKYVVLWKSPHHKAQIVLC